MKFFLQRFLGREQKDEQRFKYLIKRRLSVENEPNNQYALSSAITNNQDRFTSSGPFKKSSLTRHEWYWGDLTREDSSRLIEGKPDGSFLVRDSVSEGRFTLVIRSGGKTLMVRLWVDMENGCAGFHEHLPQHSSLLSLIVHYQRHSFKQLTKRLKNTKLQYPVVRPTGFRTLQEKFPHHCDLQSWFIPYCDRYEAEKMLYGKRSGSFLVRSRQAQDSALYACSVIYGGNVYHILIFNPSVGYYGFTQSEATYLSLQHLVLHYAQHSLVLHNPGIGTRLLFPVTLNY